MIRLLLALIAYFTTLPAFFTVRIFTSYSPFAARPLMTHEFFFVTAFFTNASPTTSDLLHHTSYDTSALFSAYHSHFIEFVPTCVSVGAEPSIRYFAATAFVVLPVIVLPVVES